MIDLKKPIQTACGISVRYIGVINEDMTNWSKQYLFALKQKGCNYEEVFISSDKMHLYNILGSGEYKIKNVPETYTRWCVYYKFKHKLYCETFNSEEVAKSWATDRNDLNIIAVKKIVIEEGEGLCL